MFIFPYCSCSFKQVLMVKRFVKTRPHLSLQIQGGFFFCSVSWIPSGFSGRGTYTVKKVQQIYMKILQANHSNTVSTTKQHSQPTAVLAKGVTKKINYCAWKAPSSTSVMSKVISGIKRMVVIDLQLSNRKEMLSDMVVSLRRVISNINRLFSPRSCAQHYYRLLSKHRTCDVREIKPAVKQEEQVLARDSNGPWNREGLVPSTPACHVPNEAKTLGDLAAQSPLSLHLLLLRTVGTCCWSCTKTHQI